MLHKDSDDAYDMDGDDIQEKINDTFRRVPIDDVVAKIMSVLSSRKSHKAEDFLSAVNYFSFIVDFYHDYAPTMKDIDDFAMMLVDKYDFNNTVLKACFLEYLVEGRKDEHGFPDIADDIETKSIQKLLEVVYKVMDCMNEMFTINLIETNLLDSLMKLMALPRTDPKNIDKDPPVLHFLGAVLGIIYMAINCSWERSQKILADDQFQFAVWKMMDYKHECRQDDLIKLRSSCIVALLLDEQTKIQIFEETTKMFISRMEEFEQMSKEQQNDALKDAARNFVNEEAKKGQENLSFYTKGIDLKEMNLDGI